jgi:hypothetical protein
VKRKKMGLTAGAGGVLSPKPNRGVKREWEAGGEGTPGRRKVKHVAVEVEKENEGRSGGGRAVGTPRRDTVEGKKPLFRLKKEEEEQTVVQKEKEEETVKMEQAEEDEFGEITMDEINWDEVMDGFENEAVVGRPDEVRFLPSFSVQERRIDEVFVGQGPPRSKQYTRCEVQEVVDNFGASNRRQKVRFLLFLPRLSDSDFLFRFRSSPSPAQLSRACSKSFSATTGLTVRSRLVRFVLSCFPSFRY